MMRRETRLTLSRILRFACPVAAAICLAGGLAYNWQAGVVVTIAVITLSLLAALAMIFTVRWPFEWVANTALVLLTALAAYGLLSRADGLLMLVGATAALAGWDLVLEDIRRPKGYDQQKAHSRLQERTHLRSLGLAVGAGLLVVAVGQNIQVRLPFIVMALLVGLGVWALERVLWEVNR